MKKRKLKKELARRTDMLAAVLWHLKRMHDQLEKPDATVVQILDLAARELER